MNLLFVFLSKFLICRFFGTMFCKPCIHELSSLSNILIRKQKCKKNISHLMLTYVFAYISLLANALKSYEKLRKTKMRHLTYCTLVKSYYRKLLRALYCSYVYSILVLKLQSTVRTTVRVLKLRIVQSFCKDTYMQAFLTEPSGPNVSDNNSSRSNNRNLTII